MTQAWDDPFPTSDEMYSRRASMDLTALLLRFARESEDREPRETHIAAAELAERICDGFGMLTDHARSRLRNSELALRDVRMVMPPTPHVHEGKVYTFKPPEPEKLLNVIKQALDKYDGSTQGDQA